MTQVDDKFSKVVQEYQQWLRDSPEMSEAVAAVKALVQVIKISEATTIMGLQAELKNVAELLRKVSNSTAVSSGSELFLRFVTRTSLSSDATVEFSTSKKTLIDRGERFLQMAEKSRQKIGQLSERFIQDRMVVLAHGFSRVVLAVLIQAAEKNRIFSVIVTESRPESEGLETARKLEKYGIPVTYIVDSAVAHVMERVDLVLVGAESVVESGGIINKIGTYQISIAAKAFNRPFYVAAESYKFYRIYPLDQKDLPHNKRNSSLSGPDVPNQSSFPSNVTVFNPRVDYTPPQYITLLFTDLGVFTPSAVSDELIKLYC